MLCFTELTIALLCTYVWGRAIKIEARPFWGRGVFVLVFQHCLPEITYPNFKERVDDLQSHASSKTHEHAQSDWRLTCGTMKDNVGGRLNAMLSDYLMSHSPLKKQLQRIILQ